MELNELNKNAMGGTELMMRRLQNSISPDLLDKFQIICSRVRELNPDKKRILWCHDLAEDHEVSRLRDPEFRKLFSKFVFVSDWQMQQYNMMLGVPYSESIVIENAIEPIEMGPKEFDGKINFIYHTTPHRGLEILVPVFIELCKIYDNLHLDVYSSFSIYGWEQRDEPYRNLFNRCDNHPCITYHGAVSNAAIREALVKSHIYAYPCIWRETSALSVIEAMSAKNIVIAPNLAALPETCSKFAVMYQYHEDINQHANIFFNVVKSTIDLVNKGIFVPGALHQKDYFDTFYNWNYVKLKWEKLLSSLA